MRVRHTQTVSCALVFALAGCGDDSHADVGRDAGRDTRPLDTGRDTPPPRDAGEWTSEYRYEPELEVHSTEACEPWGEPESTFDRGLPADSTPRLLWRFFPPDDPMYDASLAGGKSHVASPVISADGSIWVQGPAPGVVSQLDRDGRLRSQQLFFHAGRLAVSQLAAAPDGTVFLAGDEGFSGEEGRASRGSLAQFRPDGERGFSPPTTTFRAPFNSQLAIGPGGRVYVIAGAYLHAFCRAERKLWTIRFRTETPDLLTASQMMIQADGSLAVSIGLSRRIFRITPDGEASKLELPHEESIPARLSRALASSTPNTKMVWLLAGPSSQPSAFVAGTDEFWESPGVERARLSPLNVLWVQATGETAITAIDLVGEPIGEPLGLDLGPVDHAFPWDSTGGWVRSSSGVVSGIDRDGSTRWGLDPTRPEPEFSGVFGGDFNFLLDSHGVLYVVMNKFLGYELAAIQTDVLPPTDDYCVDLGCNEHRDFYMRPSPEE